MSILFVCDNVFLTKENKVYSNTFSYTLLQRYVDIFENVTVVAREQRSESVEGVPLASGKGIEFVFLENISTVKSFFGLRQKHRRFIKDMLKDHDAVIARVPTELGILAADVARENNVKCLVEVVGCAWDAMWHYGSFKAKVYAPFYYMKMRNSVKRSAYVSYVTEHFLQERYPSLKEAKTIAISDVDLPDDEDNILLQRIQKIEDPAERIIFGTIGSLEVKYKGIDSALSALTEISKKYNNFEYHILGEGDTTKYRILSDTLGIGDKVFFDGMLPGGKAVFSWLDSIDIYLQPSLQEGLPRSLIEAMSRGCPAIGSSAGGIPELLDKEMVFSHSHPEEFSKMLEELMADKPLMLKAAGKNFDRAKKYKKNLLDEKRNNFWIDFRDVT